MNCHACGRPSDLAAGARVGFRDVCEGCGADLHACRNCAHYDPGAYNACREPRAERVLDKDRANRCDEFAPAAGSGAGSAARQDGDTEAARRSRALSEAERLFRK